MIGNEQDQVVTSASSLPEAISLHLVAPIYVSSSDLRNSTLVDWKTFRGRNFRGPLIGELGCAMAHRYVYEQMSAKSLSWALVCESDAHIPCMKSLLERIDEIQFRLDEAEPTVISLYWGNYPTKGTCRSLNTPHLYQARVAPFGTVGYLLNLDAAEYFLSVSLPIKSPADWPARPPSVKFLIDTSDHIQHTGDVSQSKIDPLNVRDNLTLTKRILAVTSLWYLLNRDSFNGFEDYRNTILLPFWLRLSAVFKTGFFKSRVNR